MKSLTMVLCWFLLVAGAVAHHGPEEEVATLTGLLELRPDDAELRSRRATAYRVLGRHAEAEADLRHVLRIQPESADETAALAKVLWAQGRRGEAMRMIRKAAGLAAPGRARGAVWMQQAEWALARDTHLMAMDACMAAFEEDPKGTVDWYLLRSRIEARLRSVRDSLAGLKAGYETLGSVVLRDAWVDASLDAGEFGELAPVIEEQLGKARLRSSWLLRRGRLRMGTGEEVAANSDLKAAVEELDRRIHPERPDAKLLIDRGWARALMGDAKGALSDLDLARQHGADPWEMERLKTEIGSEARARRLP